MEHPNRQLYVRYEFEPAILVNTNFDFQGNQRALPITLVGELLAAFLPDKLPRELAQYRLCNANKSDARGLDEKLEDLTRFGFGVSPETAFVVKSSNTVNSADMPPLACEEQWISFWNEEEMKTQMLNIATSSVQGKKWPRVELFLECVCGPFDINDYWLWDMDSDRMVEVNEACYIRPGNYTVVSRSDGTACLKADESKSVSTFLGAGSTISGSGNAKRIRLDVPYMHDLDLPLTKDCHFKEGLLQRDNHCIISKVDYDLEACHILPRPDSIDTNPYPRDIRILIERFEGKFDDIRNGVLLTGSLATAFVCGHISFQYQGDDLHVVAIHSQFEKIDGLKIDPNLRMKKSRLGSVPWWNPTSRPHPKLLEFHLSSSVHRHMRSTIGEI